MQIEALLILIFLVLVFIAGGFLLIHAAVGLISRLWGGPDVSTRLRSQ